MKKLIFLLFIATIATIDLTHKILPYPAGKEKEKKEAKRQKINSMIKQSEEGVLIYSKQSIFGLQFRSNGYGAFL